MHAHDHMDIDNVNHEEDQSQEDGYWDEWGNWQTDSENDVAALGKGKREKKPEISKQTN